MRRCVFVIEIEKGQGVGIYTYTALYKFVGNLRGGGGKFCHFKATVFGTLRSGGGSFAILRQLFFGSCDGGGGSSPILKPLFLGFGEFGREKSRIPVNVISRMRFSTYHKT